MSRRNRYAGDIPPSSAHSVPNSASRSQRRTGIAIFLYGTAAAAFFAFVLYPRLGLIATVVDLNGFGLISRNLAQGHGFTFGYGPTIRRAPLYPFLGAVLLKLSGRDALAASTAAAYWPILVGNCLLFGATCFSVWRLAKRLFGHRVAIFAAASCPLLPQSLRYIGMTEVETLMGLLIVVLASAGLTLAQSPSAISGARFGFFTAAATLSKPVLLFYPFFFLPLALLHWSKTQVARGKGWIASAAALLCFAVPLIPWTLRNSAVTDGKFLGISSNGPGEFLRGYLSAQPKYYLLEEDLGGNRPRGQKWDPEANEYEEALLLRHGLPFYRYNADATGRWTVSPAPPPGVSSAVLEAEKDRIEGAEMKRRLLHEPLAFCRKFFVQLVTFWYLVETGGKSLVVGGIAIVLLLFAGLGVWRLRRAGVLCWPVVAVLVYLNGIYAAVLSLARYSMPLYPTLTVLAAGGIMPLALRLFERARPQARQV